MIHSSQKRTSNRNRGKSQTYTHLFIGLVLLAVELATSWEVRRQRAVLREWANANGLRPLKCRRSISQSLAMMVGGSTFPSGNASINHV